MEPGGGEGRVALYATYFEKDFPARTFVGSGPLLFGSRFEINGVAVLD